MEYLTSLLWLAHSLHAGFTFPGKVAIKYSQTLASRGRCHRAPQQKYTMSPPLENPSAHERTPNFSLLLTNRQIYREAHLTPPVSLTSRGETGPWIAIPRIPLILPGCRLEENGSFFFFSTSSLPTWTRSSNEGGEWKFSWVELRHRSSSSLERRSSSPTDVHCNIPENPTRWLHVLCQLKGWNWLHARTP